MTSNEQFEKWFADLHAAGMTGTFVSDVSDYYNGAKAAWHIAYHARDAEIAALREQLEKFRRAESDLATSYSSLEFANNQNCLNAGRLTQELEKVREQRRVLIEALEAQEAHWQYLARYRPAWDEAVPLPVDIQRRAALEMCRKEGSDEL